MVHLEHQSTGNLRGKPKIGTKHIGNVAHEVHRVVPDDDLPRLCCGRELIDGNIWVDINCTCNGHAPYSRQQVDLKRANSLPARPKCVLTLLDGLVLEA